MKPMRFALLVVMAGLGFTLTFIGTKLVAWREAQDNFDRLSNLPLSESKGFSVTGFAVPEDGDYLIAVSAERVFPLNTLDCLLGIHDPLLDKCEGIPAVVNATWTITEDGREIAHGSSGSERVAIWSERVYKGIGHFSGMQGRPYRLKVKFLSEISPLNRANPRIQVLRLPPPDYNESASSVKYALAKPAGITLTIAGILLLLLTVLSARKAVTV